MKLTCEYLTNCFVFPIPNGEGESILIARQLHADKGPIVETQGFAKVLDDSPFYNLVVASPLLAVALKEAIEYLQQLSTAFTLMGQTEMAESMNNKIEGMRICYDTAFEGVAKMSRKLDTEERNKKV